MQKKWPDPLFFMTRRYTSPGQYMRAHSVGENKGELEADQCCNYPGSEPGLWVDPPQYQQIIDFSDVQYF